MAGRVLNFSEFFDKYSKDGVDTEKGLDAITQSASNFEAGFDDETYDQEQLGPNRPVSGGMEMTPPQPGEEGAPMPSSKFNPEMAPSDVEEEPEEEESEEEESEEEEAEVEESEEESEEEESEEEESEEEEEGNPETEEKKESNESHRPLLGFSEFINEASNWEEESQFGEEGFEEEDDRFSEEESEVCPDCEEPYEMGANPGEVSCGCNM